MRPPQRRPQAPARPGPTISFPVPGPASQPEIRPPSQRSSITCDCGIRSPLSSCPFATSSCAWDARSWSLLSLNPVLQPLAPVHWRRPGACPGEFPATGLERPARRIPEPVARGVPGGSSVKRRPLRARGQPGASVVATVFRGGAPGMGRPPRAAAVLQVMLLTHEGASGGDSGTYLGEQLRPCLPLCSFGRCAKAWPPIDPREAVSAWWKDLARCRRPRRPSPSQSPPRLLRPVMPPGRASAAACACRPPSVPQFPPVLFHLSVAGLGGSSPGSRLSCPVRSCPRRPPSAVVIGSTLRTQIGAPPARPIIAVARLPANGCHKPVG
jgi:hypothetical protein